MVVPKVSIIIPTLNAAKVLPACLQSIRSQNYSQSQVEILILDGGSTDNTLSIARKFKCHIYPNRLKTSESGKAVGIRQATGMYSVLIDSDNILPDQTWLSQMLSPFSTSPQIIGTEPIEFTHRHEGGFIERYSSLIGANDPYVFFLGNYDRLNRLSNQWTNLKVPTVNHSNYLLITLKPYHSIPTIGANGTVFKTAFLKKNLASDYLFDIDIISQVINCTREPLYFAKVKVGIIHTYCESSINKFVKKQIRRIKDLFYYQSFRTYPWSKNPFYLKNILFPLYSLSIVLPLIDSIRGYFKVKDIAWFFHPLACLLTTIIYSYYTLLHYLGFQLVQSRTTWQQ